MWSFSAIQLAHAFERQGAVFSILQHEADNEAEHSQSRAHPAPRKQPLCNLRGAFGNGPP
jgi:hypothetical protein